MTDALTWTHDAVTAGVYFIASGEAVKIGHSSNVTRRLATFQTGAADTLRLLHAIPEVDLADRLDIEADLHRRFEDSRLRGEWFAVTPELTNYIDRLCTQQCGEPWSRQPTAPAVRPAGTGKGLLYLAAPRAETATGRYAGWGSCDEGDPVDEEPLYVVSHHGCTNIGSSLSPQGVQSCSWCLDPTSPDPRAHPGGQRSHLTNDGEV